MTVRTVTMSPGFDHDVVVDRIDQGAVGSVLRWNTHASGKGLNVSRAVHALGGDTVAYALVGSSDRAAFTALAARDGFTVRSATVDQPTRNNLTLRIDSSGTGAGHAAGPRFSDVPESAIQELFDLLLHDVSHGDVVTFNGSLPNGLRPTAWADMAGKVRDKGALLFADVQGQALRQLLETGLVRAAKPNYEESTDLADGGEKSRIKTAVAAIRRMHSVGVVDPIVTLGPLGAVHIDDGVVVRSQCPPDTTRVEVGAGDAFVAGYCSAVDVAVWKQHSPVALGLATASAHVDGIEGVELTSHVERRLIRVETEAVELL